MQLIALAEEVAMEVARRTQLLSSGALHDAAQIALAGVPTVMLFVQSIGGLSHCNMENTTDEHLALAIRALDRLVTKALYELK
jgi:N-carbamoyl-L-amino-acid hydrolase